MYLLVWLNWKDLNVDKDVNKYGFIIIVIMF